MSTAVWTRVNVGDPDRDPTDAKRDLDRATTIPTPAACAKIRRTRRWRITSYGRRVMIHTVG
jgi:hypothetical protein